MEPKFEQPKQYTPEEIAEMEKSRTISDAGLLKGGAEYVVDEKGEKELRVSEEQIKGTHDVFERREKDETERIEYTKEKLFYNMVSKYVGRDVVELLSGTGRRDLVLIGDKFMPDLAEALNGLRRQYLKKVQESDLSLEMKEELKRGAQPHQESLFDCAGCMQKFLDAIQQDELSDKLHRAVEASLQAHNEALDHSRKMVESLYK